MPTNVSRRSFLASIAGTAGAAWLATHASEVRAAALSAAQLEPHQTRAFQALSVQDARVLEAAMAQIIPTDETPGAREARVIHFLDRTLATYGADRRPTFERIAAQLERAGKRRGRSFHELSAQDQIRVLEQYERSDAQNFNQLRAVTIVGMLANPSYGGNYRKLGWQWIGFNDQYSWAPPFGWYDAQG